MNDNYLGSIIKVCLFKQSTNTILPTGAKYSKGMENQALGRSPGVLVIVRLLFVLVDYCNEYEMKLMINRYLVN